jgi:hypothetical protein
MTEFMQPINPMRIHTGNDEWTFTTPVFAISISNDHHVEYLTINGNFYRPDQIKFAEVNINGQWLRLETHKHPFRSPSTSDT